jgi:hypothetical protein
MSTHDYIVDNQNGANFRSDLNNALAAIVSNNSSATAPTTTYAFMLWADTANDLLKQRNAADSAWVDILTLSTGAVSSAEVADNAITLAKMAHGTDGEIITYDASGAPATVGVGSSGQVLTSNGAGSAPSMQDSAGGADTSLSNLTSAGEQMVCKAWVNFNGSGTVAINDDYNVSSITDNGTGDYTVNFSTAMANTSYAPVLTCRSKSTPVAAIINLNNTNPITTSNIRVQAWDDANNVNGKFDPTTITATVFGD